MGRPSAPAPEQGALHLQRSAHLIILCFQSPKMTSVGWFGRSALPPWRGGRRALSPLQLRYDPSAPGRCCSSSASTLTWCCHAASVDPLLYHLPADNQPTKSFLVLQSSPPVSHALVLSRINAFTLPDCVKMHSKNALQAHLWAS